MGGAACRRFRRAVIGEVEGRPGWIEVCCLCTPLASKGGGRGSCRSSSSCCTSLSSIFRLAGVETRSTLVAGADGASALPCKALWCACWGSRCSQSLGWPDGPEMEACECCPALDGKLGTRVLGLTLRLWPRSLRDSDRRCGSAV